MYTSPAPGQAQSADRPGGTPQAIDSIGYPAIVSDFDDEMRQVDLVEVLHWAWLQLCGRYDVTVELPPMAMLFEGADLNAPGEAAESILVNMLTQVIECIGRFSPWYKQSAEAFGLVAPQQATHPARWVLTVPALRAWRPVLDTLELAIEKNYVLLQVAPLVDDLADAQAPESTHVVARCGCRPPCTILVERSLIDQTQVICTVCKQTFS